AVTDPSNPPLIAPPLSAPLTAFHGLASLYLPALSPLAPPPRALHWSVSGHRPHYVPAPFAPFASTPLHVDAPLTHGHLRVHSHRPAPAHVQVAQPPRARQSHPI
ncbi:unnamed protein product, partial [Closterium sp. Naga37s-1]